MLLTGGLLFPSFVKFCLLISSLKHLWSFMANQSMELTTMQLKLQELVELFMRTV